MFSEKLLKFGNCTHDQLGAGVTNVICCKCIEELAVFAERNEEYIECVSRFCSVQCSLALCEKEYALNQIARAAARVLTVAIVVRHKYVEKFQSNASAQALDYNRKLETGMAKEESED